MHLNISVSTVKVFYPYNYNSNGATVYGYGNDIIKNNKR